MRNKFAIIALLMMSACCAAEQSRPNILWVTVEDMSPNLGCYGDTYSISPNLDRFAAQSVRMNRAFSTAPVCSPSRSSLITGMYASSMGTMHHRSEGVPPAYVKCFPEYLRAAGYFCTNNAKTDYNFDPPITAWDECNKDAHWKHRAKDQPFFAVFNLNTTHESRLLMNDAERAREVKDVKPRHDPAKAPLPPYYPDTPVVRKDVAMYYDTITEMDMQFAALLKEVDDAGLSDNTIVFFFSDHGECLPRGKRWLYDSGTRVPMMIRWPGKIQGGSVREDLVSFIDLAPTILSLAGVKAPDYFQGQIFLGEHAAPARKYVYFHRDRMDETTDMMRSVRDERFRYVKNFQPEKPYAQPIKYMDKIPLMAEWRRLASEDKLTGPQKIFFSPTKPVEELYDTQADPHEVNNLAGDAKYENDLKRLRDELTQWMEKTHDLGTIPEEELQQRMRPGGKMEVTATPSVSVSVVNGDATVKLACETQGASIAYTTDTGKRPHWKLYSRPLHLSGRAKIRAKACRPGFADSSEATGEFSSEKH